MGFLGMIGGLALMLIEIRHAYLGVPLNADTIVMADEVMYVVWGLGMAAAFWGMVRLGVTGGKTWMRIVPMLAVVGFVAMAIGSFIDIAGLSTPLNNPVFMIAWPLILIGTLLTGVLALVARTWPAWRKFAPLLVIVSVPVMLGLSSLVGPAATAIFGLAWTILSLAVMTSEPAVEFQRLGAPSS